jgi:hypothetical protein
MRLTGQATTALGNFIVNMIVHIKFVLDNILNILLILMLGDDGTMFHNDRPRIEGVKEYISQYMNMKSTCKLSKQITNFCRLLFYK